MPLNPLEYSPFLFDDLLVDKESGVDIIIRVILWRSSKGTNFILVFEWLVHSAVLVGVR